MNTQWRVGMSGATGLDYASLPVVMRLRGIPRSRHADVFDDVRVMEIETLNLQAKDQ